MQIGLGCRSLLMWLRLSLVGGQAALQGHGPAVSAGEWQECPLVIDWLVEEIAETCRAQITYWLSIQFPSKKSK